MKFLLAQPASTRFIWELWVVLENILSLDSGAEIVLLFNDENVRAVGDIGRHFPTVKIRVYDDRRDRRGYQPSIRPYLIWRYLSEDKTRENETYFQIDSDVIFRELPRIPCIDVKHAYGSDCDGYIGYDYLITRQNGARIVEGFARILNVDYSLIKNALGAGAQWVINRPTASLYWHIWQDSDNLYEFLQRVQSDIQKWTAEMWSQLYNLAKYGWKVEISPELDFCMAPDPIELWEQKKIYHNAGVVGVDESALFYKGNYINRVPFGDDFSWVRKDHCSYKYVEAIQNVKDWA